MRFLVLIWVLILVTWCKAWLNIVVKLREVSDAGASEMLEASLSVALVKQPAKVLAILSNGTKPCTFSVEAICSDGMSASARVWRCPSEGAYPPTFSYRISSR